MGCQHWQKSFQTLREDLSKISIKTCNIQVLKLWNPKMHSLWSRKEQQHSTSTSFLDCCFKCHCPGSATSTITASAPAQTVFVTYHTNLTVVSVGQTPGGREDEDPTLSSAVYEIKVYWVYSVSYTVPQSSEEGAGIWKVRKEHGSFYSHYLHVQQ